MRSNEHKKNEYHPSISHRMRAVVFGYLMELSDHYNISSESFETACMIFDKYIENDRKTNILNVRDIQPLGITCFWIATKIYEHINKIPSGIDLSNVDDSCNVKILCKMEYHILHNLNWDIHYKTPAYYVQQLAREYLNFDKSLETYDKIFNLIDLTYLSYQFYKYDTKVIANCVLNIVLETNYMIDPNNSSEIDECIKKIKDFSNKYKHAIKFINEKKEDRKWFHQRFYSCEKIIYDESNNISSSSDATNDNNNNKYDVPSTYASYKLTKKCGEGTYAKVYKGIKDDNDEKVMTLKRFKKFEKTEGIDSSTIIEISLLKKLNHRHIISLTDVCYDNSNIVMVYDYCRITLHDLNFNYVNTFRIKKYMKEILQALEYCHAYGIIHCDVKPANILINKHCVKLCDFSCSTVTHIENKYAQMVTLWYRSPELLLGSTNYGTPVDIWSAGCILAEMHLRHVLFESSTKEEQLDKIFRFLGTPDKSSELISCPEYKEDFPIYDRKKFNISETCDDLLYKMLEMNPSKRICASDALKHEYFKELDENETKTVNLCEI